MRIIKSEQAWWALASNMAARIPPELASLDLPEVPEQVMRALVESAAGEEKDVSDSYFVTALTSTNCNLACHYCFQHENVPVDGELPLRIPDSTMDESTVDRVMDFTERQMRLHNKTSLRLLLFGGEPLLAPRACLSLLNRAAGLGLAEASMISNGVLLTGELARKLAAAGLSSVQITLDGDREAHDGVRHTKGRRGTYDGILRNIAEVRSSTDIKVYLRVNLSATSAARLDALVSDLGSRLSPEGICVAFALVKDPGIGFADLVEQNKELADAMISAYVALAKMGFEVPIPAEPGCETCGEVGGGGGAVVNADGILYSCWESAGKPGWDVGDVDNGFVAREQLEPRWVACGYADNRSESDEAVRNFQEMLDGALLDALYREGVLHKASQFPGS